MEKWFFMIFFLVWFFELFYVLFSEKKYNFSESFVTNIQDMHLQ